ncbi:MAG: DNA adenine methylase [Spirochaetales bacterium]|nr:DNA adenine methylase [Spirochaetales bacterium]
MDLNTPYLTQQIIAYIGNKRRLLDLIHRGVLSCYPGAIPEGLRFFDLFSGSGIVARLGKHLGFDVTANDWEHYSYILNRGYLVNGPADIEGLFGSEREFSRILDRLNSLPSLPDDQAYIARYYSAHDRDIEKADFRRERLFYTRENGQRIDRIRQYIEEEYGSEDRAGQKDLLTALLLYEASTHTNTSGVFKAFHKGFGGHGRDAMKRITAPITLTSPPLIEGKRSVRLYREDANMLVRKPGLGSFDLAYLDPPYNQHQYGSNYHMLNTIALWDKIPAPLELNSRGILREKAAIRKDWVNTRSDYCYQETAISSFRDLLDNLDARNIIISYSTDGIIPFEVMKDLCVRRGEISLVTNEYTTYRGGRQSNSRRTGNIEFVLVVRGDRKSTGPSIRRVDDVINRKKLLLLFKQKFSRKKLAVYGSEIREEGVLFSTGKRDILLKGKNVFTLSPPEELDNLTREETDVLYGSLSRCICHTKEEELEEILNRIGKSKGDNRDFLKLLPDTLKKLAHKKNRKPFYLWLSRIETLKSDLPGEYRLIEDKIEKVKTLAEIRFKN